MEHPVFEPGHQAEIGVAQPGRAPGDGLEGRLCIVRRLPNDTQAICGRGLPSQRLVALACQQRDLLVFVANGRRATTRDLWRFAALYRHRLPTSRFNWFAACSGAPSHWLPLGSGTRQLSTLEVAGLR